MCNSFPPQGLFRPRVTSLHPAELFARDALSTDRSDLFLLGELLDLLPQEGKERFGPKEGSKYWSSGLFVHGPYCGLRSAATKFPLSTKLACKCVAAAAPGFPFTTITLLLQVRSSPHKDVNNRRGWHSFVAPIGDFEGGEIWVQGGREDTEETVHGVRLNECLKVSAGLVWLYGGRLHLTRPWNGVRKVVAAYSIRDLHLADQTCLRKAKSLGFPLPSKRLDFEFAKAGGKHLDFDSTLGYPGEGPLPSVAFWSLLACFYGLVSAGLEPRNQADLERAQHRSPLGLQAGRVVLPKTGSRRGELVAAFSQWLLEVAGYNLDDLLGTRPLDAEAVSDWLVRYGRDLYGSGRPYWHYSETINAVTSLRPILRRQVQAAWDLGFAWRLEEPSSHHIAIPPIVFISLLTACLLWGWVKEAGCFALAFGGLMRIGEVVQASRASLVLPADVMLSQRFILFSIQEPKTRGRGPRHQSAKIEAEDLVQVITIAFGKLQRHQRLWPLSPQTLRKRLDILLHKIGAAPVPHGTRPIDLGATYLLQLTEDSELVSWYGGEGDGPLERSWKFIYKKLQLLFSFLRFLALRRKGSPI